jgi:hypothetical protein
MGLLILGLVVFFVYTLIRLSPRFGGWISGSRFRAYRQLAARYNGRSDRRSISDSPVVSFKHNGSTIRVGLAPTNVGHPGQVPATRIIARFGSGIPFRLELAPTSRPKPPQAPKGTRVVRLDEPEFDRGYVVQANDADMARDFLTPSVREVIANLHRGVQAGGMLLSINPQRMLFHIDRNLGLSTDALMWAVEKALVLHDALIEGVSRRVTQGIAIVDEPSAREEVDGPPVCKVCGEPIAAGEITFCSVCNTPHHRDCWEYVGACSIYGCNGKVGVFG